MALKDASHFFIFYFDRKRTFISRRDGVQAEGNKEFTNPKTSGTKKENTALEKVKPST